ncbi:hypothetical protein [Arthrobacter monumenti]
MGTTNVMGVPVSMFTIYARDDGRSSGATRVLDPETGTTLQLVSLNFRSPGGVFILAQGDARIRFTTSIEHGLVDSNTGEPYRVTRIEHFGKSYFSFQVSEAGDHEPRGLDDKFNWLKIAVEALLVFGDHYDGFRTEPDYARIELNGQILTRRDFGYTS